MKVKELIEKLKDYQDFEVEITIYNQPYAGAMVSWDTYIVSGIEDIGHSDKRIILDATYKERE